MILLHFTIVFISYNLKYNIVQLKRFFIAYSLGRNRLQMEDKRSTSVLLFPIPHSKIAHTSRPYHKVWLNYKTRGENWPISWKHSRLAILKSIESWWKLYQVPQVCCILPIDLTYIGLSSMKVRCTMYASKTLTSKFVFLSFWGVLLLTMWKEYFK